MARPRTRTPIESVRHKDKRTNIPTSELERFVPDEQRAARPLLWKRDPSLDPQLVWRGKDEEDAGALEVPSLPIYIQEKIHPQAIIEDLRREARAEVEAQMSFFSDFNGIQFEELVDFYRHEQNWANRMILGDSLLVMASLAHKENLKGKVQMIYVDPPYGIKFGSNWQVSTRKRDVKDGKAEDLTRQPEQVKAFRDTWELGINSYLSYLRDRLVVARDLLTESGSIFVQIGDDNVHHVREVMDEVFGRANFVSLIAFATTSGFDTEEVARGGDYLIWYARDAKCLKSRKLFESMDKSLGQGAYRWLWLDGVTRGAKAAEVRGDIAIAAEARVYAPDNIQSQGSASEEQRFWFRGKPYTPNQNSHWKAKFPEGMQRLAYAGRIHASENSIRYVRFAKDFDLRARNNIWTDTLTGQFTSKKVFAVQTNTKVVERCILMTTDPGDLVLDPTCGSGTTAYVAEQCARRWITIDTSRVALALARTRLMSARFPFWLLNDSPEGRAKLQELEPTSPLLDISVGKGIKGGLVCARAPHIKLEAIGDNEEIDSIHARYEETLVSLLASLNSAAKKKWQEWEVPRDADAAWPERTAKLHAQWWDRRRARQNEIDDSIARHSDTELLYDQPYEDKSRIRVAGPFTVESLSPHRVLSPEEEQPQSVRDGQRDTASRFVTTILDNLRRAGVQNTKKGERLVFERLDPFPGVWLQAVGEYVCSGSHLTRRLDGPHPAQA